MYSGAFRGLEDLVGGASLYHNASLSFHYERTLLWFCMTSTLQALLCFDDPVTGTWCFPAFFFTSLWKKKEKPNEGLQRVPMVSRKSLIWGTAWALIILFFVLTSQFQIDFVFHINSLWVLLFRKNCRFSNSSADFQTSAYVQLFCDSCGSCHDCNSSCALATWPCGNLLGQLDSAHDY